METNSTNKKKRFWTQMAQALNTKATVDADTLQHSWFNLTAHIIRERTEEESDHSDDPFDDGLRMARCRIKNLEVYRDGNVRIWVEFYEDGQLQQKTVTPMALVNAQCMYANKCGMSDTEEDDQTDVIKPARQLPRLTCTNINLLAETQQRKLEWVLKETNLHQNMMQRIPAIDTIFQYQVK